MNGCTALFPRSVLVDAGLFDERRRTTQDYALWFRLCGTCDFVLLGSLVLRSRIHKGQGTYLLRDSMSKEVNELYSSALDLYRPGSIRYDLDLAKTAFALRLDPRRKRAFWKVWRMAALQPPRPSGLVYLALALVWNRWLAKVRIDLNSLSRRRKQKKATKNE